MWKLFVEHLVWNYKNIPEPVGIWYPLILFIFKSTLKVIFVWNKGLKCEDPPAVIGKANMTYPILNALNSIVSYICAGEIVPSQIIRCKFNSEKNGTFWEGIDKVSCKEMIGCLAKKEFIYAPLISIKKFYSLSERVSFTCPNNYTMTSICVALENEQGNIISPIW